MKRIIPLFVLLVACWSVNAQVSSQRVVFSAANPPTACVPGKVYTNPGLNPAKAWVGTSTGACTEIDPSALTATTISTPLLCTDAGANDTYTCTPSPAIAAYVSGQFFIFTPNTANTGAATLNVNSKGAKNIKKLIGASVSDPADNDLRAGGRYIVVYDGTEFLITSLLGNAASGGGCTATLTMSILLSSTSVNLNEGTGAKQTLYTCPASRRCIITGMTFQKFSGADTSATVITAGWNGVTANDVIFAVDLSSYNTGAGPTNAINANIFDPGLGQAAMNANPVIGTAGDVVGLKVTTPKGSALTAIVDVFGYLTDTSGVPVANVCGPQ